MPKCRSSATYQLMDNSSGIRKLILKWCCICSFRQNGAWKLPSQSPQTCYHSAVPTADVRRRHIGGGNKRAGSARRSFNSENRGFWDFQGWILVPFQVFLADHPCTAKTATRQRRCCSVKACCPPIVTGETPFRSMFSCHASQKCEFKCFTLSNGNFEVMIIVISIQRKIKHTHQIRFLSGCFSPPLSQRWRPCWRITLSVCVFTPLFTSSLRPLGARLTRRVLVIIVVITFDFLCFWCLRHLHPGH